MSGINRGFALMMGALAAGMGMGPSAPAPSTGPVAIAGGGHAVKAGTNTNPIGGTFGNTLAGFVSGGGGGYRVRGGFTYPNQTRGHSAAQGKRNARKRRNVLRSRGHHRQAVR